MQCTMMKNNIIFSFVFEEPMVTGETISAMMEETVLHHIPVRTMFQFHGETFHFSCHISDCWVGRGDQFPEPLILYYLLLLHFFFRWVCERHYLLRKGEKW